MFFPLQGSKKKADFEQSLILRTFSTSTTIPEEAGEANELVSDDDSEIEYQLQLKPKANKSASDPEGVVPMEVVAVAVQGAENEIIGGDVESSVTMFVNSGFVDSVVANESVAQLLEITPNKANNNNIPSK